MTTGIRRFILRFIVGLVTFLIGVAAAMAIAGFNPFESNHTEQRNYRQYRYKKSCNFSYRSWNTPHLTPPPQPVPAVSNLETVHLKGPDGITVTVVR